MRVGMGYDVHKLVEGRDLIIGGVKIPHTLGLLGHSDADVTWNVYTHASYAHAESAMWKILQFQPNGKSQKFG